jgi:hypothetical protein
MTNAAGVTSTATRPPDYVHVACQVPNFSNAHVDEAQGIWAGAGFTSNVTINGNGNFPIGQQSLAGGTLNPPNDCAASITLSKKP